jgi:RND family efflux transporter MFP subunit
MTQSARTALAFVLGLWAAAAHPQPVPAGAASAPAVRTQTFAQVALYPEREAPAAVVPRNEARLAAEVSGRVRRWSADTGAMVRRGALLVELDDADFRLSRDRAIAAREASQARLALAQQQLQRARELVEQGFFSREALNARQTEVRLAETDLAASQAQLASAELALTRTRISAPFNASVKERLAQAGEFVAAGAPLYVLTQTDQAEVSAQVALHDVASLRASDRLVFVGSDRSLSLKLLRVASTVTAPARTVEVRLASLDSHQTAVVGSAGQLRWRDPRAHVPAALLVQRERRLGLFVVEAGKAKFLVLPQAQEGRAASVDLAPQAQLVVEGQAALRDGQDVAPAR